MRSAAQSEKVEAEAVGCGIAPLHSAQQRPALSNGNPLRPALSFFRIKRVDMPS
jgi:hypothetical protein